MSSQKMTEQHFQVPVWMSQWAGSDPVKCLVVYVVCAKYSRKPWGGAPAHCSSVYLSSIMKMTGKSKSMSSKLLRSLIEASDGKLKRLEIGGHQSEHQSGHLSHFIQWTYREYVDTSVDTKVDHYHMSIPDDKPIVSKDTIVTLSQSGNGSVTGKRKRKPRKKTVAYTPDYEELWDLWPRPLDDKQRGAVAYFGYLERNNQIHSHVMQCARSYLSTVSDPQYCKALANWLNSDSIERKGNAAPPRLHVNATEGPEPGKLGLSEEQKANRLRRLAEITKNTPAGPRRPGG